MPSLMDIIFHKVVDQIGQPLKQIQEQQLFNPSLESKVQKDGLGQREDKKDFPSFSFVIFCK